jgi:hypothetical protein
MHDSLICKNGIFEFPVLHSYGGRHLGFPDDIENQDGGLHKNEGPGIQKKHLQ